MLLLPFQLLIRIELPLVLQTLLKIILVFMYDPGTITQLFGVGKSECSVILLATYGCASVSLTLWCSFFMWLVLQLSCYPFVMSQIYLVRATYGCTLVRKKKIIGQREGMQILRICYMYKQRKAFMLCMDIKVKMRG